METLKITRDVRPELTKITTWEIDPAHSSANFSVRHMMIAKVHGGFSKLSGSLRLDTKNIANSFVEAKIDAANIDTREPKRDEHLRGADFFDVAKYPTISFRSKKVREQGGAFLVIGDLTMHGVTAEVPLIVEGLDAEIKDPWGNIKIGATATTKIRRKDFGLTWNAVLETGGVVVGEEVTITLDIQFIKKT
jgi:polyisoprenoid-binding protein YceI